jgi:glycerophosphoryl diester phosphodiesterase
LALLFPFPETALVAHRGAHCCGSVENSLAAIEHAVELAVPGIELDVCNLGDGELVLSHDPYVSVAGAAVPLPALSVRDVAPLMAAGRLVLAQSALDLVRSSNAFLCLDWKGCGDEPRVVRLIDEFGLRERTIVSSAHSGALARIKDERPGLPTGLSFPASSGSDDHSPSAQCRLVGRGMLAARADAAMLELSLASPAMFDSLRREGSGVFVWTARDARTFAALAHLAPDGIMSDAVEEHLSLAS